MKLSEYAKLNNISYKTAWRWFKTGLISGVQFETGTIRIPDKKEIMNEESFKVSVYARVSSSENKDNLERQAQRVSDYCIANGFTISEVVKEIGSGLNDSRPKFNKLLNNSQVKLIVVEHKDRACRFGFNHIQAVLSSFDRKIIVINEADSKKEDLIEDFVSVITSFCSRIYGKRRSKRKTESIIKSLEEK